MSNYSKCVSNVTLKNVIIISIVRKIILSLVAIALFSLSAVPVFAETAPYEGTDACNVAGVNDPLICGSKSGNEEEDLQLKVKNVLEVVYLWIGIIAVIFIVIGGIKYTTSAGEASRIESAKKTITFSIIGLVVVLAAFAITEFFIGAMEGQIPDGEVATPVEESSGGGDVEVSNIRMAQKTSLTEGNTHQLKLEIVPDYAKDHKITFTSSNPEVAIVSETGMIKAIKPGVTKITATATNGVKAETEVTVKEIIKVKTINVYPKSLSLTVGKSATISIRVIPSNAVDKTVTWSSSNTKIATVSNKGVVKAKSKGDAKITVKSSNGVTATVPVKVKEKPKPSSGGGGSSGNYSGGKGSLTAAQRQKIVEFSRSQIGVPYNYGAGGACGGGAWSNDIPNKQLACNGLTRWAYAAAGVTIPEGSREQMSGAPVVTSTGKISDMTPGDIIVFDDCNPQCRRSDISFTRWSYRHVAIYEGDGKLIEATCPKAQRRAIGNYEYSYSITW